MPTQFNIYSGTDDHAFQYIFRRRESIISIPIQEKVVIHFSAYLKGTNIHFNIYLEGDIHTFQYKWRRIPFILVPIYKEVAIHFQEEMTIHLYRQRKSFYLMFLQISLMFKNNPLNALVNPLIFRGIPSESMDFAGKSIDFLRKPVDFQMKFMKSIDLNRKSVAFQRKSINFRRKSIVFQRKSIDMGCISGLSGLRQSFRRAHVVFSWVKFGIFQIFKIFPIFWTAQSSD